MLEAVRTVEHKRGRYAEITLNTCAYAGTGNVLKVRSTVPKYCSRYSFLATSPIDSNLHCFTAFLLII